MPSCGGSDNKGAQIELLQEIGQEKEYLFRFSNCEPNWLCCKLQPAIGNGSLQLATITRFT